MGHLRNASLMTNELREFASISPCEPPYIKRSIDIGLGRQDAFKLWAWDATEIASIRSQYAACQELKTLRATILGEASLDGLDSFMGKLVRVAASDLAQDKLDSFSSFRFLYERVLGARIRPRLPAAFCAASALPQIRLEWRKALLHSIGEAAATAPSWSDSEPLFFPEWVEKDAA
ncbi:MAG: hypothetical protein FJX31_00850 [Alphaproteobacteria bacterium]|nr:hypothetical protein [Alphaproteobacteria bacterium]